MGDPDARQTNRTENEFDGLGLPVAILVASPPTVLERFGDKIASHAILGERPLERS